MTHIGSGWERLSAQLEKTPKVHVFSTGLSYHHPDDVRDLKRQIHRRHNSAAVWADVILHNKDFTMKRLCGDYRFVFWSAPFGQAVEELKKAGYGDQQAEAYYSFRLEGMRQYFNRCPVALWNPSLEGDSVLESFLG